MPLRKCGVTPPMEDSHNFPDKKKYDYPELNGYLEVLKNKLKQYYDKNIISLLYEYELIK